MTSPASDATYTTRVFSNSGGSSSYIYTTANAFTGAASGARVWECRATLIAYIANKANGGSTSAYLTALKNQSRAAWSGFGQSAAETGAFCMSMTYDWIYADLDSVTRANFLADLQAFSSDWETSQVPTYSPFNDQAYIDGWFPSYSMVLAIAQYPEGGATSRSHLRWAMDWTLNIVMPVIDHQFKSGCWHETWEYTGQYSHHDMYSVIGPNLLAWSQATANYPGFFTNDHPGLINAAMCPIYQLRGDWTLDRMNGSANGGWINPEGGDPISPPAQWATPGLIDIIAEAYHATTYGTTLRYFSREVNWAGAVPNGLEPSGYPYLKPDSSGNTVASNLSALPPVKAFTGGWGLLGVRSGWGENDTSCFIRFGDHFWSHDVQDLGSFNCYNRGGLAIRSGEYQAGSLSQEYGLYAKQAVSQNVMLFCDGTANSGNDYYSTEKINIFHSDGTSPLTAMPNDCGERRVGSGWQTYGVSLNQYMESPYELSEWVRSREIYHGADLVGFSTNSKYDFACLDMAPAYNNLFSHGTRTADGMFDQPNSSNRTYRVQKYQRCFVFIPRGTDAYLVVYDQMATSSTSILKKWQLHTIEQPVISGNKFTVTRNQTVTATSPNWISTSNGGPHGLQNCSPSPCTGSSNQYVYAGTMEGWMTLFGSSPSGSPSLCTLGGIGTHDFDIGGRCSQSTFGTNYNDCMQSQCDPSVGTGPVADQLRQVVAAGPHEPGSWRIEEEVGANHLEDWGINVILFRNTANTTVSTAPVTTDDGSGNWSTTWKDNSNACTYTLVMPKYGMGGSLVAGGTCLGGVI